MTIKPRSLTLANVVVALVALVACNGILGNEVREADAGAEAGPSQKCPGQKYCSAIDSCGPKDDPSFGCASESCTPCNVPNATPKCGGAGCTVGQCFPGFRECTIGTCTDLSTPANCGQCGVPCGKDEPFCAPSPGELPFLCVKTCPAPQDSCGLTDRCFDLTKSATHCGSCDTDCTTTVPLGGKGVCKNGVCQVDCLEGFHKCGSGPAATCEQQDARHCGAACTVCPTGPNGKPQCSQSGNGSYVCSFTCNVQAGHDFRQCAGSPGCVDVSSDVAHCGSCTEKCVAISGSAGAVACTCVLGVCSANCRKAL